MIVGRKITIVDFESSSTWIEKFQMLHLQLRRLCIGSGISKIIGRVYKIPKKQKMITVLRRYKQEGTRESFEEFVICFETITGSAGFEPATTSPPG